MPQEFAPGLFVQINRVQVGYLFHFKWPLRPVACLILFICKLFGNKLLLFRNQEVR